MIKFLLISFFVILALGAPIAVALGLSSILGIIFVGGSNMVTVGQRVFEGMNSFALLAVPLFTFAGLVMGKGGIAKRIINFCYSIVGHVIGGLAHVNVLVSMIFGGISGAAVADTAGVSGLLMPQMMEKKYSKEFTVAVTAISSTIGIVIPPSIPMVVISGILGISTGKLFLGGIIPGILIGISQMIVSYFIAKKEGVP
ncbi:MAG TPA: TRAP transporter large permease subunit, partial [Thermoanaerobacterales bacterium]|nr:TRAP transporter large permease subunit [Thermoanaerobacterales bacterium]